MYLEIGQKLEFVEQEGCEDCYFRNKESKTCTSVKCTPIERPDKKKGIYKVVTI